MIALDMDGCVTNFIRAYTSIAKTIDKRAPIVTDYNEVKSWEFRDWWWPEGYTEELNERVWHRILNSPTFWMAPVPLFPHDMPFLASKVRGKYSIVFMTRRDGVDPWGQTVWWLKTHGIAEPLVVRVRSGEEKGELCHQMGIRVLIDDAPKYIEASRNKVHIVMPVWPYNEHVQGVTRVKSLGDAIITAREICRQEIEHGTGRVRSANRTIVPAPR